MQPDLSEKYKIVDSRSNKDFKEFTYNGYKKNQVFSQLQKNILDGNIEKSLLWSTELHCSCYIKQIYNKLFSIFIKNINKENISLLEVFKNEFNNINRYIDKKNVDTNLRNCQYLRNHISNLVILLIFSPKYNLPKLPKIPEEDYNMHNVKHLILNKNLNLLKKYLKLNDNKNIIVPLNEIIYNLNKKGLTKSLENTLYWLNWILIYEKTHHGGNIKCSDRIVSGINKKFYNDFTWIIWDIILEYKRSDNYIECLYELYKYEYSKSKKKFKINLIILAFIIIINPVPGINENYTLDDEHDMARIKILANINMQYLDIVLNKPEKYRNKHKLTNTQNTTIFSKNKFKNVINIDKVLNKFNKKPTNINANKIDNNVNKK